MAEKKASLLLELKDKVSKSLGNIGGRLDKFSAQLDKSKFLFAGVAAASGLLAKVFINAADKMEQWTISFEVMLGSAEAAKIMMEDLATFAAKTPFELPGVITSAKQLLAMGIESQKVIPTLKSLGDVSAGLSIDVGRLAYNYGQVRSQTKLTGVEMKDFVRMGVPLYDELAKVMNVTVGEVKDLVSAGKVGFPQVEAAFKSMSDEGGAFANMMERQMETFTGIVSNVSDEFFQLSAEMGKYLLPAAKQVGLALLKVMEWLKGLAPTTKLLILAIGGLVGGFAALMTGLAGLSIILPAIGAGFLLLISPITIVILAIGGIVAALAIVATNAFGLAEVINEVMLDIGRVITLLAEAIKAAITFNFKEAKDKTVQAFKLMKESGVRSFNILKTNIVKSIKNITKETKLNAEERLAIQKKQDEEALKALEIQKAAEAEILKKAREEEKKKAFELSQWRLKQDKKDIATGTKNDLEAKEKALKILQDREDEKRRIVNNSLTRIATLSTSKNKALAVIGKATAISMATIDTYKAGTKALASAPPPWNFALMAGVIAAGMAQVANIAGVQLAKGGIVLPRAGGTLATIAEAGRPEAVIPLDSPEAKKMMGTSSQTQIIIQAGVIVADDLSVTEFAKKIDEKLFSLRQNNETLSFD